MNGLPWGDSGPGESSLEGENIITEVWGGWVAGNSVGSEMVGLCLEGMLLEGSFLLSRNPPGVSQALGVKASDIENNKS